MHVTKKAFSTRGHTTGSRLRIAACAMCLGAFSLTAFAQDTAPMETPVSFSTAIDLALKNSAKVQSDKASVEKAEGLLMQSHDVYIPSVAAGSSLGYSYGFPLGTPTLFNITSQALVFNFSQKDYIRSARANVQSTQLHLQQTREEIIEDAAITYISLDTALQEQKALEEQDAAAAKLGGIATERESAGVDSHIETLRAQLTRAQIHLRQIHGKNTIAEYRDHLSRLTGLAANGLATETATIPAAPPVPNLDHMPQAPGVRAAYEGARAAMYTAFGDQHALWRPSLGFDAQYSRLASFNDYTQYYQNFNNYNDFGIGIMFTLPIFDAPKRAVARQSAAEAVRVRREADLLRDQAAEGNLKMVNSLQELAVKQTIAQLESEIATEQLKSVQMQLQSSTSTAQNAPQLSPKDEQNARIDERGKYVDMLGAQLELTHLQLDLLKASGGLEDWARSNNVAVTTSK